MIPFHLRPEIPKQSAGGAGPSEGTKPPVKRKASKGMKSTAAEPVTAKTAAVAQKAIPVTVQAAIPLSPKAGISAPTSPTNAVKVAARNEEWNAVALMPKQEWEQAVMDGAVVDAFKIDASRARMMIGNSDSEDVRESAACKTKPTKEQRDEYVETSLHSSVKQFSEKALEKSMVGFTDAEKTRAVHALMFQMESLCNQSLFVYDTSKNPKLLGGATQDYFAKNLMLGAISSRADLSAVGIKNTAAAVDGFPKYEILQKGDTIVIRATNKGLVSDPTAMKPVGFDAICVEVRIDLKKFNPKKLLTDQPEAVSSSYKTVGGPRTLGSARFEEWDASAAIQKRLGAQTEALKAKSDAEVHSFIPADFVQDYSRMNLKVGSLTEALCKQQLPGVSDTQVQQVMTDSVSNMIQVPNATARQRQDLRYQVQDLATQRLFSLSDELMKEAITDKNRAYGYDVIGFKNVNALGYDAANPAHVAITQPQIEIVVEGSKLIIRGEKRFVVAQQDKEGTPHPIGFDALKVEVTIDMAKYDPSKMLYEQADGVVTGTSKAMGLKRHWNLVSW